MRHQGVGQRVAVSAGCVSDPHVVDAVSGCVMLVTRDVFDAVGVFDDDYFFSFEDIDFCLRARTAGFLTVLARDAIAYHEGGRSIGSSSPERLYFAARNHLLLARRTAPAASALARAYQQSAIVALNVGHAMIAGGGSMPRRLAAVMRGTRDYLAARYGPGRSFGVSGAASDPRARRPRSS
jgi:GT2 family glycosyltransferase